MPPQSCRAGSGPSVAYTNGYWRIKARNETALKDIVASVGPVAASMNGAVQSFWYYSTGVYGDLNCVAGNSHSVLIVGYGDDNSTDPPTPYWLCKNSWYEKVVFNI